MSPQSTARVSFDLGTREFMCTANHPMLPSGSQLCEHIRTYLVNGRDVPVVRSLIISGRNEMKIGVPMADGLIYIPVTLSMHSEDEILDNGKDSIIMKFVINDDFYNWPDMNNPSLWTLLQQFEGAMRDSELYRMWNLACIEIDTNVPDPAVSGGPSASLMRKLETPCKNKHHSVGDTMALVRDIQSGHKYGASHSIIMAETVSTYLSGRCRSCVLVKEQVSRDNPFL